MEPEARPRRTEGLGNAPEPPVARLDGADNHLNDHDRLLDARLVAQVDVVEVERGLIELVRLARAQRHKPVAGLPVEQGRQEGARRA